MTALTQDRLTNPLDDIRFLGTFGLAAGARIFRGSMVATQAADGFAVAASADPTLRVQGTSRSREQDNTTGADGDLDVTMDRFPQRMVNSAAADEIQAQHVGQICYVVDDTTVALTSGGGSRPIAGVVRDVDTAAGVLVDFTDPPAGDTEGLGTFIASLQITTVELTDAAVSQTFQLAANAPPGVYVVYQVLDTVFSGGGSAAVTGDVGSAGVNADLLADAVDIFTGAVIAFGPQIGDVGATVATTQTTADIEVVITADVNVVLLTAGDTTYHLYRVA